MAEPNQLMRLRSLLPGAPAAARGGVRVTTPALARHFDELRMAEQAKALDRHFGRIAPEAGPFDDIDIPDLPDPVSADRAVTAAPASWLERAEFARSMEPAPAPPLSDMLLDNDRRRALIANRLDRLTPEQQARSLPVVGRQYEADQAAQRAADIQHGRDVNTAAAIGAAGVTGAAAFAARMAQLAQDEADAKARQDMAVAASMSMDPDGAMPMTIDTGYDPLMDSVTDSVAAMKMPLVKVRPPRDFAGEELIKQLAGGMPPAKSELDLFEDDDLMPLEPDSPDDAIAAAPGPSIPVGRAMDMEDLPGPQLRSVQALVRAGIPAGRAMDIITKGSSMSPGEYRMVTGGRR